MDKKRPASCLSRRVSFSWICKEPPGSNDMCHLCSYQRSALHSVPFLMHSTVTAALSEGHGWFRGSIFHVRGGRGNVLVPVQEWFQTDPSRPMLLLLHSVRTPRPRSSACAHGAHCMERFLAETVSRRQMCRGWCEISATRLPKDTCMSNRTRTTSHPSLARCGHAKTEH